MRQTPHPLPGFFLFDFVCCSTPIEVIFSKFKAILLFFCSNPKMKSRRLGLEMKALRNTATESFYFPFFHFSDLMIHFILFWFLWGFCHTNAVWFTTNICSMGTILRRGVSQAVETKEKYWLGRSLCVHLLKSTVKALLGCIPIYLKRMTHLAVASIALGFKTM